MRRFFRLADDVEIVGRWHIGAILSADGMAPFLFEGIPFDGPQPLTVGQVHAGRALEFSITSFSVPVLSRGLASKIERLAGADVQWLLLDIPGHGQMVVANVIRQVRCLDETRSEFLKWTADDHRADLAGRYRQVTKLVLDPTTVPSGAEIFRVEAWPVALIVSEAVKIAMEEFGSTGAVFTSVMPER